MTWIGIWISETSEISRNQQIVFQNRKPIGVSDAQRKSLENMRKFRKNTFALKINEWVGLKYTVFKSYSSRGNPGLGLF